MSGQVSDRLSRCEASPVSTNEIDGSFTLAIVSGEINEGNSCDWITALPNSAFDPPFNDCFEFKHDGTSSGRQTPDTPESVRCLGRAEIVGLDSPRPPSYTEAVAL